MTDNERLTRVERFLQTLRQCRELGMQAVAAANNHLVLRLPYSQAIVGDPATGVIHGGAITTLMDTTSGSVIMCALPEFELCPTLDLRVDYMRSAEPDKPVYARATAYKITRNIIFTRCLAFQLMDEAPDDEIIVAQCVATFMRIGAAATPQAYRDLIQGPSA